MDNKKIGIFISTIRKSKTMTQQELADKLGVTNKAISKWETGEGYPEITIIPELAKELGISIDELLTGKRSDSDNIPLVTHNHNQSKRTNLFRFKTINSIAFAILLFGIIMLGLFAFTWPNLTIIGLSILLISIVISFIIFIAAFNRVKYTPISVLYGVYGEETAITAKRFRNRFVRNLALLIIVLALTIPILPNLYSGSDMTGPVYFLFMIVLLIIAIVIIFILHNRIKDMRI